MNFLQYIKKSLGSFQIKKETSLLPYTLSIILAMTLFSCADDLKIGSNSEEGEGITLTICIPDVEGAAEFAATRDDNPSSIAISEAEEGNITNLWLYAFADEKSPNGAETKITGLTEQHSSLNVSDKEGDYKKYNVYNFKSGNYHIYLLANLNRYLPAGKKMADITTKQEVEDLLLNFDTDVKIEKGTIPMYCLDTQIKSSATGDPVDINTGIYNLQANSTIYADMTFLCAKVRYTVLFDRTESGFSNQFASNDVDFTTAQAFNNPREVKLYQDIEEEKTYLPDNLFPYPSVTMNKVAYPDANDAKEKWYFNISKQTDVTDESVPNNLGTPRQWNDNTAQRAWQGVVYLPENLSKDKSSTATYIELESESEELSGMNLKFQPHRLVRGKMYDYVAKLKKTAVDIDFKVRDWTTQEIVYALHGPYQLIVEHTDIHLDPGFYFAMGYETETSISFDFPKVTFQDSEGNERTVDFYEAEIIDSTAIDENGELYNLNSDLSGHFRIRINPEVPFHVLYDLEHQKDEVCKSHYNLDDYNYFHVVAGNLHKKITTTLGHSPFLHVTPELMTIEVHEYYLKGINEDNSTYRIKFRTNYDLDQGLDFFLVDSDGLVVGLGDNNQDMILNTGDFIDLETTYDGAYAIHKKEGELVLNIKNLIGNHPLWAESHEYKLQFYLQVRDPHDATKITEEVLREYVTIIVKPYNSNYILHFYDATGKWETPHIYILQALLLPSDLKKEDGSTSFYAGKIVGYIENNNNALEVNAAAEYVFTNNISFRGWSGYGGPDINNPNDFTEPTEEEIRTGNVPNFGAKTEGFVMFGARKNDGTWNADYGYTVRTATSIRHERYNYDLDFNDAHVKRIEASSSGWKCQDCLDRDEYINIGFQHDYPGIVMEKEDDNPGWWRYTLTGVAQPGKTMIIFANTEAPWERDGGEATNRYPGSYNTGLTLFDFEDNEGWFVYKGENSESYSPTDHFFYDDKPAGYN